MSLVSFGLGLGSLLGTAWKAIGGLSGAGKIASGVANVAGNLGLLGKTGTFGQTNSTNSTVSHSAGSGGGYTVSGSNDEVNRESWEKSLQAISSIMGQQNQYNQKSMLQQMGYNTLQAIQQGVYNHIENTAAMNYNSAEAAANRAWQEHMSNTSYQRAVEDMRKAGINPILAYAQGGASTPGGAQGTISGASMGLQSASALSTSALAPGQQSPSYYSQSENWWHNLADTVSQGIMSGTTSTRKVTEATDIIAEAAAKVNGIRGKTSPGQGGGRNR